MLTALVAFVVVAAAAPADDEPTGAPPPDDAAPADTLREEAPPDEAQPEEASEEAEATPAQTQETPPPEPPPPEPTPTTPQTTTAMTTTTTTAEPPQTPEERRKEVFIESLWSGGIGWGATWVATGVLCGVAALLPLGNAGGAVIGLLLLSTPLVDVVGTAITAAVLGHKPLAATVIGAGAGIGFAALGLVGIYLGGIVDTGFTPDDDGPFVGQVVGGVVLSAVGGVAGAFVATAAAPALEE